VRPVRGTVGRCGALLPASADHVVAILDAGWHVRANALRFVPEGAGAHHGEATADDGRRSFATWDDLDAKP
jgi:hypothetical protein